MNGVLLIIRTGFTSRGGSLGGGEERFFRDYFFWVHKSPQSAARMETPRDVGHRV